MVSQISQWGNSQGIRISKKIMRSIGLNINDKVEIISQKNVLIIKPEKQKSLSWYLEGYENETDRYDWGSSSEPKGRELI